ncbi:MAG: hypothetical protein KAS32_09495 [Candidatus Peribacteraceae bacterium]|nr:hypothetical protein [Candidatus Peribacteraceae bacterium]
MEELEQGEIYEIKTVMINIPQLIEDFYYALSNEEYEECDEYKKHFYKVYHELSEELRTGTLDFLKAYLKKYKIDNEKDLNGFFDEIL